MRIKLISPETSSGLLSMKISFFNRKYGGAPLALSTLAALTPVDIEISITDENVEPINFDEKIDLVGVTFNVSGVTRAYEISNEYQKRGVTVVLGGFYTSMLPKEAIKHADAIVIGEAEEIWEQLIRDFQNGKLQTIYQTTKHCDLKTSPIPRWELLKSKYYHYHSLQITRGCPFDCDYCSVTYLLGGTYRYKPIENVIKEIEHLQKIDKSKLIFFVDDNIASNRIYTKELCKALIPFNIRWYSQAPITVAKDEEMLELMHKSGCRELFIGFESLSQESLEAMGKGKINKVDDYEKSIATIYSHGISIFGSFMLGGECDDETIFQRTVDFINHNYISFSLINIVVPPPGTRLFQRLDKERRILHKDWSKYSGEYVCFKPNLMTPEQLQRGFNKVLREIYSYDAIYKRLTGWWAIVSGNKEKHNKTIKNILIKLFIISMVIIKCFKTKDRINYFFKTLWISKLPISIIILGETFHNYAFYYKKHDQE